MSNLQHIRPFLSLRENGHTLVSHLAMHGEEGAVKKTIAVGGRKEDAVYGYSLKGDSTNVNAMIASAEGSERDAYKRSAIAGYARAGNSVALQAIEGYRKFTAERLLGLAQAGKKDRVTTILDANIALFPHAVEGYATCNHGILLSKLIKGTSYYPLAIHHAARSGHVDLVNHLLEECGVNSEYVVPTASTTASINAQALLNYAAKGYTAGGHFNDAAHMLARGASITQCLSELNNARGKPDPELCLIFLAHITQKELRARVYEQIKAQGKVDDEFNLGTGAIEQVEAEVSCMQKSALNYLDARKKISNPDAETTGDHLTLPFLSEQVKSELDSSVGNAVSSNIM